MTDHRIARGLYLPSPQEAVDDLPSVKGFYVFGYVGPWKAPLADAVRSNLRSLSDEIPGALVVSLEDLGLIRRFSEAYGLSNLEDKVCLFVTDARPGPDESGEQAKGVLLDMRKLAPDQVPTILVALLQKLGEPDFMSEIRWEMRKLMLKRLVDRFAFGIVTTAVGFAG